LGKCLSLLRRQDLRDFLHHLDPVLELGRLGGAERGLRVCDPLAVRGQNRSHQSLFRLVKLFPGAVCLPLLLHQRADLFPLSVRQIDSIQPRQ